MSNRDHWRDLELTEFDNDELVARFQAGLSLSRLQKLDAERLIAARARKLPQAAE
jgi:hypothetical protein